MCCSVEGKAPSTVLEGDMRRNDEFSRRDEKRDDRAVGTFETARDESVDETVCNAVVRAVAAVKGTQPIELQPLRSVVDPDALDRLITAGDRNTSARAGFSRVAFRYEGCAVVVTDDGRVGVTPHEASVSVADNAVEGDVNGGNENGTDEFENE